MDFKWSWNFNDWLKDNGAPVSDFGSNFEDFFNDIGDTFFGGSHSTNQTNLQMNRENIEMMKDINTQNINFVQEQNAINRAREDNAVQRAAQDMTAAGLSKTLAAGQPASAQNMSAPQAQAPSNTFQMQKNLAGMNFANFISDMHFKKKADDRADELNDANVALLKAQADNQNITNQGLADRLLAENALTIAKTEETNVMMDFYKVQTDVERQIGEYKSLELQANLDKTYQDIAHSKKLDELSDSQIDKLKEEIHNIVQDTLNKELQGQKTQEEINLLVKDYEKAYWEIESMKHDLNYAQTFNLPVGSQVGGLLGNAINFSSLLGGGSLGTVPSFYFKPGHTVGGNSGYAW